jgi:glycerol uptake facilitator-like aquaporin
LRRSLSAEVLGTGILVAAGLSGAGLVHAGLLPEAATRTLGPSLTILALIYALSDLSGSHFNPVVTLAFALRGSFPWARLPGYWAAQLAGLLLGGGAAALWTPLPAPVDRVGASGAFGLEVVTTALLLLVILSAAKRKAEIGTQAALAVAATVALCRYLAGSLGTIDFNPLLSLARHLFSESWAGAWPHLSGPVLGALIAVGLTFLLRGRMNGGEVEAAGGEP